MQFEQSGHMYSTEPNAPVPDYGPSRIMNYDRLTGPVLKDFGEHEEEQQQRTLIAVPLQRCRKLSSAPLACARGRPTLRGARTDSG